MSLFSRVGHTGQRGQYALIERVTLAPLSSAHRTRAIAALCEVLNSAAPCFPGTRLRLRFAVRQTPASR